MAFAERWYGSSSESTQVFHVQYLDGTYGVADDVDAAGAEDQLTRSDSEMAYGAKPGRPPKGAKISISTVGDIPEN